MTTPNSSQFDCGQFADALADVLEREVSEPTRSAVEAHALACAECGALLADLRKLRIDAANLPALTPSRDLWNGIADRIETPVVELGVGASGRRGVGAWKRRVAFGIAAAALVAVTATITHELTKRSMASVAPPVAVTPSKSPTQPTQVATISPPTASTPRRLDASTPRRLDAHTPRLNQTLHRTDLQLRDQAASHHREFAPRRSRFGDGGRHRQESRDHRQCDRAVPDRARERSAQPLPHRVAERRARYQGSTAPHGGRAADEDVSAS